MLASLFDVRATISGQLRLLNFRILMVTSNPSRSGRWRSKSTIWNGDIVVPRQPKHSPFGHYVKFKAPSVTVLQEIPDYMENNLESSSFVSHNVIRQGFVDFNGEFVTLPNFPTKIPRLLLEHKLSHLHLEQQRDEADKGYGSSKRDHGSENFENRKGKHKLKRVLAVISPTVEQMGHPAEHNERDKLKEHQFERNIRAADEVNELNRDGKIRHRNQKVANFLALQNVLNAPKPLVLTITPSKAIIGCCYRNVDRQNQQLQHRHPQHHRTYRPTYLNPFHRTQQRHPNQSQRKTSYPPSCQSNNTFLTNSIH
nr:hypothetical protein Iba_chr13bCG1690 [Ipomoea batatas]